MLYKKTQLWNAGLVKQAVERKIKQQQKVLHDINVLRKQFQFRADSLNKKIKDAKNIDEKKQWQEQHEKVSIQLNQLIKEEMETEEALATQALKRIQKKRKLRSCQKSRKLRHHIIQHLLIMRQDHKEKYQLTHNNNH